MATTIRTILKQLNNLSPGELERIKDQATIAIANKNIDNDIWKTDEQMRKIIAEYREAIMPIKIKVNTAIPIRGEIEIANFDDSFVENMYPSFDMNDNLEKAYNVVYNYDYDDKSLKKYFPEAAAALKNKDAEISRVIEKASKRMEELRCNFDNFIEHIVDQV